MIIDAHCHAGEAKKHFSEYFAQKLYVPLGLSPEAMHVDIEKVVANADAAFIDKIFLFAHDMTRIWDSKCPNEYVAEIVKEYPDRFIGFAGVDPLDGLKAVQELEIAINKLGLKGLKFLPAFADLPPNDPRMYPIYEKAQELNIPVNIHMGWLPIGHMKNQNPILIDDVAIEFPKLKIIVAHAGFHWATDCFLLMKKHLHVYADLSLWFLLFPADWVARQLSLAKHQGIFKKLLWGSDYPDMEPKLDMERYREIPHLSKKLELRPNITEGDIDKLFGENAAKIVT